VGPDLCVSRVAYASVDVVLMMSLGALVDLVARWVGFILVGLYKAWVVFWSSDASLAFMAGALVALILVILLGIIQNRPVVVRVAPKYEVGVAPKPGVVVAPKSEPTAVPSVAPKSALKEESVAPKPEAVPEEPVAPKRGLLLSRGWRVSKRGLLPRGWRRVAPKRKPRRWRRIKAVLRAIFDRLVPPPKKEETEEEPPVRRASLRDIP